MCNNYALHVPLFGLRDAFEASIDHWIADLSAPNLAPSDDIRPTDLAPVVLQRPDGVALTRLKWGLVPQQPKRPPVINFRSEGRAFERGRCLIPASSFFEFTGTKTPMTRWRFTRTDGDWFCIAGLESGGGDDQRFTMLTCAPGPDIAPIHDRQIVVLDRDGWAKWMGGAPAAELLLPSPAGTWTVTEAPRAAAGTLL
ncbi:MAG: SOS response-associated peptidase [Pseudomonadota bacterium]